MAFLAQEAELIDLGHTSNIFAKNTRQYALKTFLTTPPLLLLEMGSLMMMTKEITVIKLKRNL